MAGAREIARTRVAQASTSTPVGLADAASDVWDPLLREAYTALERSTPREGDSDWHQGVLRRLREALAL